MLTTARFCLSLYAAQVQVWLFDIEKDPTESHNLAATQPALLEQLIAAYEEYQQGAVDDISSTLGVVDPAADPSLRPDKTWGPFLGSKLCKWKTDDEGVSAEHTRLLEYLL